MRNRGKWRKWLWWGHLVLGLTAGAVIALLAATGIVMSLETAVVGWADKRLVLANGPAVPVDTGVVAAVLKSARQRFPQLRDPVLVVSADPAAPLVFRAMRGERHLYHPSSGEYLGTGPTGYQRFFQAVTSLHRWLTVAAPQAGSSGERSGWRDWGGQITAAACLAYVLLTLSGLVLWAKRVSSWPVFRTKVFFRWGLPGKARDWNWHHAAGIWASPLVLVISLCGLIMAYPSANRLLFAAFGETPPARQAQEPRGGNGAPAGSRADRRNTPTAGAVNATEVAELIHAAVREVPQWRQLEIAPPGQKTPTLWAVTVSDAGRGRPDRRKMLEFEATTLRFLDRQSGSSESPAVRARRVIRWIHTGEAGGWWGQLLAVTACMATLVLVWTGMALSWRRFFSIRIKHP